MSLYQVFDISGSGLRAQSMRLTTTASNLSNADVASRTPAGAYHPKYPIFQTGQLNFDEEAMTTTSGMGVSVAEVFESPQAPIARYQPSHPLANEQGYVFMPNVNMVEEMTNMISASRSYRMNLQVLSSAKELLARTLQLGE